MSAPINIMLLNKTLKFCDACAQFRFLPILQRGLKTYSDPVKYNTFEADEEFMDEIKSGNVRTSRLKMRVRNPKIPPQLLKAIDKVLDEYPIADLAANAKLLSKYLQTRKAPLEKSQFDLKLKKIEEEILEKANFKTKDMDEKETDEYLGTIKTEIINKLQRTTFKWHPINYDGPKTIQYLAARMTTDYSTILTCLSEIQRRDPDLSPENVFVFGSGVGSDIWATNKVWPKKADFYCVDHSADMNTVARLLLQEGNEDGDMLYPTYFRHNIPSDIKNEFDLVITSYSLMEMASRDERYDMIKSLWNMTGKYLVIIEKGGVAGFDLINEARDWLIQLTDETKKGHLFAPCPHQQTCPKIKTRKSPCFFETKFYYLNQVDKTPGQQKEWYSYLIFKVGPRSTDHLKTFPKIVQEVQKKRSHTHVHVCCSDGQIRHVIISAAKHGIDLFRTSRSLEWGDYLPINFVEKPVSLRETKADKIRSQLNAQTTDEETNNPDNQTDTPVQSHQEIKRLRARLAELQLAGELANSLPLNKDQDSKNYFVTEVEESEADSLPLNKDQFEESELVSPSEEMGSWEEEDNDETLVDETKINNLKGRTDFGFNS